MPIKSWGVIGIIDSALPTGLPGYLLFFLYAFLLALIIYRSRLDFRWLSLRQWAFIIGLSLASFWLNRPLLPDEAVSALITTTPFSAGSFLLAGAMFNPAVALLVGFFAGLGRVMWLGHSLFSPFHFAFAAALAATLMRQNFRGTVYDWMRHPVVSGALATTSLVVLNIISGSANAAGTPNSISALDQAVVMAAQAFWPLVTEGMLGGILLTILVTDLPHLRPKMTLVVSPWQRSLRRRLLSQFVLFATFLAIVLIGTVLALSLNMSTKLVVNQMAHNAQTVSADLPGFQAHLQETLDAFEDVEGLLDSDVDVKARTLQRLGRPDTIIRSLFLIDSDLLVAASYLEDGSGPMQLTAAERAAVRRAFETNSPRMATAESKNQGFILTYIVPVLNRDGETEAVLVGRVPPPALEHLIVGLYGTAGQGIGFLLNERDKIIAHPDENQFLETWQLDDEDPTSLGVAPGFDGLAFRTQQTMGEGRALVYVLPTTHLDWKVVTTVPNSVVLNLALGIGGPLTLVLFLVVAVFYARLATLGKDISEPITALVESARNIAAGGRWLPPPITQRNDEIGHLSQAFGQMHHFNNKRLKELSLLLDVSHSVASEIDVFQGMPAILRGALRGTGAAGARAAVVNPSGNTPQTFGEGPLADKMASLDWPLMDKLRHADELVLSTTTQISTMLEVKQDGIQVPALFALPLRTHGRFRGVLWLAYRQPHGFDPASRTLVRTLASQASLLVENAHLYTMAEGGRRRLAAVLASTADAVVVTDQTERVLLINRAMEIAFDLKASDVIGRRVSDVIKIDDLIDALTGSNDRVPNVEVSNSAGKIFFCNVSPIINGDGRAIGRVAVLHDISALKDIDHMKTDFVNKMTHELLTPLTLIAGYVSALAIHSEMNAEQEGYIERIQGNIDQGKEMVEELLELGRLEAGIQIDEGEIDIKLMMSDIYAMYRQPARIKGIKLSLDVPSGLPSIQGDLRLVQRALTNLLNNGLKYAPHSGLMVMRAELSGNEMLISLADNGPGVPKEHQMRLFEKFYRVRKRQSIEEIRGAGLGLATVKSVAELHGGKAWVESEEGKGSTFYFSLSLPASET